MKKTIELKDLKCREDIYKLKRCKLSRSEMLEKAIAIYNHDSKMLYNANRIIDKKIDSCSK